MGKTGQKRIVGLLGVGFDTADEQIRITQSEQYQVLMGSGETHSALQKICRQIDECLKASGRTLSDCTPEEFMDLVQELY
jgi:hypothetical protein